jgi:hypothetical protein
MSRRRILQQLSGSLLEALGNLCDWRAAVVVPLVEENGISSHFNRLSASQPDVFR